MADFLSDEWIDELALACRAAPAGSDTGRFVIEPVVSGVPARGEVRYRLAFTDGACAVESGVAGPESDGPESDGGESDVRLETDYVTAVALSRGTANAQVALADGRLRVSGDVARLSAHAAAVAGLDDLFAALRATTTYPAP